MTAWMEDGDCRSVDPELFFPLGFGQEHKQQVRTAIDICLGCPVQQECLDYATENALHGIWGGSTDEYRAAVRRRQKRQKASAA